jgi:hypothetical protein
MYIYLYTAIVLHGCKVTLFVTAAWERKKYKKEKIAHTLYGRKGTQLGILPPCWWTGLRSKLNTLLVWKFKHKKTKIFQFTKKGQKLE